MSYHFGGVDGLLRRLFLAFPLAFTLVLLVDHYAIPLYVWNGYQQQTKVNVLEPPPVDKGAGSHDIYYLAASFDCDAADLWLVGEAPPADYWQVGIYDLRMRQIPSGHLNHRSIQLDDNGHFEIHITPEPTGSDNELDCQTSHRGMLVVRIIRPTDTIVDPVLELR